MKRFLLLFLIILLSGCSYKFSNSISILECSSSDTFGSTSSLQIYKIQFNNDKMKKLSLSIDVNLNEEDDVTRDNLEKHIDEAFSKYKNRDGISYFSDVNDNGFKVDLNIDFNSLSEEDKSTIGIINFEKNYDEIKNEFESNGFICK